MLAQKRASVRSSDSESPSPDDAHKHARVNASKQGLWHMSKNGKRKESPAGIGMALSDLHTDMHLYVVCFHNIVVS